MIEGLEEEQKSTAAQRCARIYAECDRKPGKTTALILWLRRGVLEMTRDITKLKLPKRINYLGPDSE